MCLKQARSCLPSFVHVASFELPHPVRTNTVTVLMAPDDDNEDYHRLQRELHATCLAGDIVRLRQLFTDADLDATDATDTLTWPEDYPLITIRCLLDLGADVDKFVPWAASDGEIQSLEAMELMVEFGYDVKAKGHLILQ